MFRRTCYYCSAELPAQRQIKLQFRDRLCVSRRHPLIMPDFPCWICHLVKLKFWDYLSCFWSNQLLNTHLHQW